MPAITNVPTTWTGPVSLAADEVWQCKRGRVALTVETSPGDDDGVILKAGEALPILSGKSIRYRRIGYETAAIAREAF